MDTNARIIGIPPVMMGYRPLAFGDSEVLQPQSMPIPVPGAGEVLVKVGAIGICGQDIMRRAGKVEQVLGSIMGHEFAGTVIALGPSASRFAVGERVAALQRRSCHLCSYCRSGQEVLCMQGKLYGTDLDGCYAQYCVMDELSLARVPRGVSTEAASVAACAIGTAYHALSHCGVTSGQRVLVTGASGGLGIHALQLARVMGAEVLAVTSSPENISWLRTYADEVFLSSGDRFDEQVRDSNRQPDVVLETTAGITLHSSLRSVRRGGTVAILGTMENTPTDILPGAFIVRELRLVGSKACTLTELETCLSLLDRGLVDPKIHQVLPLSAAAKAHQLMESGGIRGRLILKP